MTQSLERLKFRLPIWIEKKTSLPRVAYVARLKSVGRIQVATGRIGLRLQSRPLRLDSAVIFSITLQRNIRSNITEVSSE